MGPEIDLTENRVFRDSTKNKKLKPLAITRGVPWQRYNKRGADLLDLLIRQKKNDMMLQERDYGNSTSSSIYINSSIVNVTTSSSTTTTSWMLNSSFDNHFVNYTPKLMERRYIETDDSYGKSWALKNIQGVSEALEKMSSPKKLCNKIPWKRDPVKREDTEPINEFDQEYGQHLWVGIHHNTDLFSEICGDDDLWDSVVDFRAPSCVTSRLYANQFRPKNPGGKKWGLRCMRDCNSFPDYHKIPWEHEKGEKNPINSWDLLEDFVDADIAMPNDTWWLNHNHNLTTRSFN